MFGVLEKMTIFAVVSCNNIIMAKENIIERINSSKKVLEKYDPLVLIEKLKSRDLKASNYFYAYTSALMEHYLIRFFSPKALLSAAGRAAVPGVQGLQK